MAIDGIFTTEPVFFFNCFVRVVKMFVLRVDGGVVRMLTFFFVYDEAERLVL